MKEGTTEQLLDLAHWHNSSEEALLALRPKTKDIKHFGSGVIEFKMEGGYHNYGVRPGKPMDLMNANVTSVKRIE